MSIVGSVVQYTDEKSIAHGLVLDQILMKNATNDPTVVTGYLIQSVAGKKIKNIQHWRIVEVMKSVEEEVQEKATELDSAYKSIVEDDNDIFQAMNSTKERSKYKSKVDLSDEDYDDDLPF